MVPEIVVVVNTESLVACVPARSQLGPYGIAPNLEHGGDIIGVVPDHLPVLAVSRPEPFISHSSSVDEEPVHTHGRGVQPGFPYGFVPQGELGAEHGLGTIAGISPETYHLVR